MLVLLRSIVDGTRRTAAQLVVGCVFGGLGAIAGGVVWGDSQYVYLICGIAAVVTENVIIGIFNASKEFRDNPKSFFTWAWKLIVPTIPIFKSGAQVPLPPPEVEPASPTDEGAANG